MKRITFPMMCAGVLTLGLMVASCNNNQSNNANTTGNADTTKKMTDTSKAAAAPATPAGKVEKGTDITIHAVGNNMSEMHYDVSEIDVPANTKIKVTLIDDATDPSMQHNIVFVRPGDMDSVAMHGITAGIAKGFVPADKEVIAASKLTQPGGKTEVTFTTPAAGEYRFMCTYPGHYQKMNGKMIVQ